MSPALARLEGPDAKSLNRLAALGSHGPWSATSRPGRLSYLAFRTVTREGPWVPRAVEGEIPRDIIGTLYRNGPGQKEVFDVPLGHLFDGDAYLTAMRFADGRISGLSRFVATEERMREQSSGRMRYHEFGTRCPGRALGFKNPPSINVFVMADGHFALSEGAAPVLIDPDTLECRGAARLRRKLAGSHDFYRSPEARSGDRRRVRLWPDDGALSRAFAGPSSGRRASFHAIRADAARRLLSGARLHADGNLCRRGASAGPHQHVGHAARPVVRRRQHCRRTAQAASHHRGAQGWTRVHDHDREPSGQYDLPPLQRRRERGWAHNPARLHGDRRRRGLSTRSKAGAAQRGLRSRSRK